jgi:hypothetical protein
MMFFNAWYYSFSPRIATYLSAHQNQRAVFRYALYPLTGVLYLSYYTYLFVSPLNSEVAALSAGLIAALLLGFIYIGLPLYLAARIMRRKLRFRMLRLSRLGPIIATAGILVGVSYLAGEEFALGGAIVSLILSTLGFGVGLGVRVVSQGIRACSLPQFRDLSRNLIEPQFSSQHST